MKKIIRTEKSFAFKRWSRKGWGVLSSLHRHTTIGVLSVSMSIILLSSNITFAQSRDTVSKADSIAMLLNQATVTSYRASQMRSVGTVTTLYNREVEAAAPFSTMESVLRLNPSVDVRERGWRASQADIHLRGGSADQTQIMLNGVNFTDARTGHQSHALPVDIGIISSMDFIEDICGTGAYAGAVNVRTVPRSKNYFRLEGSGGSFGYADAAASGAFSAGGFNFLGAASYMRSDGYRHNTDFNNTNAFARLTYYGEKAGYFDLQGGYQYREFGSDGFYAAYNPDQWEKTSTGLTSFSWKKRWNRITVRAGASYRKNFDRYDWVRGTAMNHHETDNAGANLELSYDWAAGNTALGGDYTYNHIFSSNLGLPMEHPFGHYAYEDDRNIGNVWLRHAKHWTRFSVSGCAGMAITPYGNRFLWSLSGEYRPGRNFQIEAGAVQSMRLPTFTDLYYTSPAQINNLDLVPEEAVTYRLKASFVDSEWSAAVGAYYRDGRNVIDWVWHDEGEFAGKWHSEQTGRLGTFGVEVAAAYLPEFSVVQKISFSYAYINTTKRDDNITKNAMDYMRNKASAEIILKFPYGFRLAVVGSVYDRAGNYTHYFEAGNPLNNEVREYEPYALLDARFSWTWRMLEIFVDGTNLTNTKYCDIGGLPLPGIAVTAGAVFKLDFKGGLR